MLDILVRTYALGDTLWTKQIFNDWISGKVISGTDIELAGDGGFFISGFGTNMTDAGVWLLKTDANGNLSWWKFQSYGGIDTVFLTTDLRVTPDGGVVICGSYKNLADLLNTFLMKFDQQGCRSPTLPGGRSCCCRMNTWWQDPTKNPSICLIFPVVSTPFNSVQAASSW